MRGSRVRRWIGSLLTLTGIALLAWCALVLVDARITQRLARESLDTALAASASAPVLDVKTIPKRAPVLEAGAPIAALSIPRLELSEIVLHGSDALTLRRGPGHLEHTPLPGEPGNVVIAGHRDTFFSRLQSIQVGDDIFVESLSGRFHYRVTSLEVVHPQDVSVLAPTRNATLTLITCYPFWVLGPAPDRFVVHASRVMGSAAEAPTVSTTLIRQPVPVAKAQTGGETPTIPRPRVADDATLIREAIERFRLTYNARLVSHNDSRPAGPLKFATCDIRLADSEASAICGSASQGSDDAADAWRLTLSRSEAGWAIRTIVAD